MVSRFRKMARTMMEETKEVFPTYCGRAGGGKGSQHYYVLLGTIFPSQTNQVVTKLGMTKKRLTNQAEKLLMRTRTLLHVAGGRRSRM